MPSDVFLGPSSTASDMGCLVESFEVCALPTTNLQYTCYLLVAGLEGFVSGLWCKKGRLNTSHLCVKVSVLNASYKATMIFFLRYRAKIHISSNVEVQIQIESRVTGIP